MLRKALKGAAAAGAATLIAVGAASPAMAHSSSDYDFDQNDFGGVNVLSNFCVNVSDVNVIQLIDLLTNGNASCEFNDSHVWVDGKGHHHDD
ncbi:hypothetical protein [Glycomyces algeriensis]|uniref:DUF320 domain-containing protein n=1 Tax=Glycomyces algeriensis TaxID=256037 RepID=A0A9W6GCF7_9ACTN|nr:hypothetical protein [Glycomyces algeriensis]MDA1365813.1 hypothetical protein [Glycomyces algeriensis]MDR7351502.1 hypothetical protein [Glycomyces algeriensis]GLI44223.1 hypothetical protein GALLR39Z86_40730 [Glycomyces algeriensis]